MQSENSIKLDNKTESAFNSSFYGVFGLRPTVPLDKIENYILKRGFDIFFSLIIIILFLSWMIPLFAILIKLTSKGSVFFKQIRTGENDENFMCWKFRSMYINENAHFEQAAQNDLRITFVGHFLRKFSLDETPQFFNVLLGHMSVVGPRPHMLYHTESYSLINDDYSYRHFIKPGITGLSQVEGYRGEITNENMLHNRVRLDLFYMRKWNFMLDIKIILKTVKLVLFGDKNAY
jgi:lipopolysaccharide/colanic/teichoic acid biosynthesis glycosyltransferase